MARLPKTVFEETGTHLALLYDRVSEDKRKDRRSTEEQDAENRADCEENGWPIGRTFTDPDYSASRFAAKPRPEWPKVLAELEERRHTVLVLWESSRGERELEDWARMLNRCRHHGILIHITSNERTYDMRKPGDWKSLAQDGLDSAYESEKTSQRVQRTVRGQANKGRPHGRLNYGYRREYDRSTGRLLRQVLDEQPRTAFSRACLTPTALISVGTYTRAGIVKEIADRFLRGDTEYGIAKDLNDRGIPTSQHTERGWWPEHVRTLILRPAYIGKRVFRGKVIGDADWPAILEEDTHYRLVAKLTAPSRKASRDNAIVHELSGLAVCGVCGYPMRVGKLSSGGPTYQCRRAGTGKGKGYHVACSKRFLEDFVREVVIARLSRPDVLDLLTRDDSAAEDLRRILDEVAARRARLQTFYDKATTGELSAGGLAAVERPLLEDIRQLEERAGRIQLVPVLRDLIKPDADDVAEQWDRFDVPRRREVIRALIAKIEVLPVGKKAGGRQDPRDSIRIIWRGAPG